MRSYGLVRLLCVLTLVGCGSGAADVVSSRAVVAADGRQPHTDAPTVTIIVIAASDSTRRLPGVEAFVIHGDGTVARRGVTDEFGRLEVPRDVFVRDDGRAVGLMVCLEGFYCGIIRQEEIVARTDATIALATRVIR